MRVALLGCGRVANHYEYIIKKIKEIKVIACCDIIKKKADYMASKYNCKSYSDESEMYKSEKIDFVFILTESGNHYINCLSALKNNINILVEKPITLLVRQALKLEKISKKKNLVIENVFQNRFNPSIIQLKKAFERKKFGKIVTCSINLKWHRNQSYYEDGWHGSWLMDGGVINQQAIHHLDVLNWICGPIKRVIASKSNIKNNLEAEDTMVVLVEFENGYTGTIEASTAASEDIEAAISVFGTKGYAKISGVALNKIEKWSLINPKNLRNFKTKYSQKVKNGYGLGHLTLLKKLVQNYNKKTRKINLNTYEALNTVRLVHAIYRSVEDNKWVDIKSNKYSRKLGRND